MIVLLTVIRRGGLLRRDVRIALYAHTSPRDPVAACGRPSRIGSRASQRRRRRRGEATPRSDPDAARQRLDRGRSTAFLVAARQAGHGRRRSMRWRSIAGLEGELCGLRWAQYGSRRRQDADRPAAADAGPKPISAPRKPASNVPRLSPPKRSSATGIQTARVRLKMANRTATRITDWCLPRSSGTSNGRRYARTPCRPTTSASGSSAANQGRRPSIKFHGLRHTYATLLLQAGSQSTSSRSGSVTRRSRNTLNIYAHVLPTCRATRPNASAASSPPLTRLVDDWWTIREPEPQKFQHFRVVS